MIKATKRNFLKGFIALTAAVAVLPGSSQATEQLEGDVLLDALSGGVYVSYMRHTKTDKAQKDGDITDLPIARRSAT